MALLEAERMTDMDRWNGKRSANIESPDIDHFLDELRALCKKHNISIGHEDGHGAFEFYEYSDRDMDWMQNGHDMR